MYVRARILVSLLCTFILIPVPSSPSSPDLPSTLALGVVLNHLMDQLQQAIEAARNAGLSLEIEAGRDTTIAIQDAQNAYAASLNLTMDRVDQTTRQTVDQLSSLVNDVSNNVFNNLDDVTRRVQQITNSLPFRDHEPQLTKISPRFVVPSITAYPAIVRLDGNFEYAARPGFEPSLKQGGNSYPPTSVSTQSLAFSVPVNTLFPDAVDQNHFGFTTINVEVPWEACSFKAIWCWFHKRETDTYRLFVGALPQSPGKLTLQWKTSHNEHHTKGYVSQEFYQSSGSDGANDDHKDVPYSVHAEPGWHIQQGTASFNETPGCEGDRSHTFVSDDGDVTVFRVTTIHHGIGTAGREHFTISFTEYQEVDTPDNHSDQISLRWGDSKTFNYPINTWQVLFDAFDGSHSEFVSADDTNHFVKLRNTGGGFVIQTADPASLQWP